MGVKTKSNRSVDLCFTLGTLPELLLVVTERCVQLLPVKVKCYPNCVHGATTKFAGGQRGLCHAMARVVQHGER